MKNGVLVSYLLNTLVSKNPCPRLFSYTLYFYYKLGWVGVMVDRGYFEQLGVILDKYGKIINNDA